MGASCETHIMYHLEPHCYLFAYCLLVFLSYVVKKKVGVLYLMLVSWNLSAAEADLELLILLFVYTSQLLGLQACGTMFDLF